MRHEAHFTILANSPIRDGRLSGLARSVLMELISRPPGWQTNADEMWKKARRDRGDRAEGRRAFRAAFAELEEFNYLIRERERHGSRFETVMHLFHLPQERVDDKTPEGETPDPVGGTGSGTSETGTPESGTSETGTSIRRTDHGSTDVGSTDHEDSSSSAEVEDITNVVVPEQTKKRTESPEAIIERRLGCTPDEAAKVATLINQQGDGKGGRIRSLSWWVENRDLHTLRQDLAIVRGHQGPAEASKPLDEGERIRRMQKGGYQPYRNPVDQDVYDEPILAPASAATDFDSDF